MKRKTLIKKLKFSEQDFEKIRNAVKDAEKNTTGEIVVAIAPESAHYSFWELLAANILAIVVSVIALPFTKYIRQFYEYIYWHAEPTWILPAFYIVLCFSVIVIGFYLSNIPFIDKIIIPKKIKKLCVTQRAIRYFSESGVYNTKEHSGVLIYVSYMEKQIRIIADSGISKKISNDLWKFIADEFTDEIKNGNKCDAFVNIIKKCGTLLSENFPAKDDNPNELEDGLVILGGRDWF